MAAWGGRVRGARAWSSGPRPALAPDQPHVGRVRGCSSSRAI